MVAGQFDDRCLRIDRYRVSLCGHREIGRARYSHAIVAAMGGNAGTQTPTVAVRALAVRELTGTNALRIVGKETLVGGINGVIFAVVIGGIAGLWFDDPTIGGIIRLSMIVNLLLAGLAGTVIPVALDRLGVDPAVGSAVVLTTVTGVIGFLSFLGLATMVFL